MFSEDAIVKHIMFIIGLVAVLLCVKITGIYVTYPPFLGTFMVGSALVMFSITLSESDFW